MSTRRSRFFYGVVLALYKKITTDGRNVRGWLTSSCISHIRGSHLEPTLDIGHNLMSTRRSRFLWRGACIVQKDNHGWEKCSNVLYFSVWPNVGVRGVSPRRGKMDLGGQGITTDIGNTRWDRPAASYRVFPSSVVLFSLPNKT